MMQARRREKVKAVSPDQKKQGLLNALGGLGGLSAPSRIPLSVSSQQSSKELESEKKNPTEEKLDKFPEFVKSRIFGIQVAFSMIENDGYTEKSFRDAWYKHYNIYDRERLSLEKLEEVFNDMKAAGYYDNIMSYVKEQQSFNHELENVELTREEFQAANSMYKEARLRLLADGVTTENPELQKKILIDVETISNRFIEFFSNQDCVTAWNPDKFVRLLAYSYVRFLGLFHDDTFSPDKPGISDTNSLNEFSSVTSSIVCNVYQHFIINAHEADNEYILKKLSDISSKPIFGYKGVQFDKSGQILLNIQLAKDTYAVMRNFISTYKEKIHLVSEIDEIKKLDWVRYPPFDPKKEELKIPKGDFVIRYYNQESIPELYFSYCGRVGESWVAFHDSNVDDSDYFLSYSVSRNKFKVYQLDSYLSLHVSALDHVGVSRKDTYVIDKKQDWFKEVSDIGLDLKYNGLQLIANIEKLFPGVFDQAYNMDPIEIDVDQENSRLRIISSRSFLDRNLAVFDITQNTVTSRKNGLFDGVYYEKQNIDGVYKDITQNQNKTNDEDNLIHIKDDSVIVLEFPLSYFFDGISDTSTDESPEVIEQKINDWKSISKYFSSKSQNRFTYEEFLDLIKLDGEICIDEASGKGSHYKLFQMDGNGRFITISKKKRTEGFYLIDLKSAMMTLGMDFQDFYKKLN